ncbi:nitrous oxide reductase accessory protein NosL [Bdellovibrionota bacterium FG-2]
MSKLNKAWLEGIKNLRPLLALTLMSLSIAVWASDNHCDVCGMIIPEHAKNHIVLHGSDSSAKGYHICSASCARKIRKNDPKLSKSEVADFNHPDSFLSGNKAFFLIQSQNIKSDMGEMAMPPLIAGFQTKKEAEAARTKYGDGVVVEGFENALK